MHHIVKVLVRVIISLWFFTACAFIFVGGIIEANTCGLDNKSDTLNRFVVGAVFFGAISLVWMTGIWVLIKKINERMSISELMGSPIV